MTQLQVGVVGAGGKVGRQVCAAIIDADDLTLAAAIDPGCTGDVIEGVAVSAVLDTLTEAGVEVVVDFTVVDAARTTLPWLADHGIHAVVGTTGFSAADLDQYRAAFTRSNCLIASNFAISAVLMMRFAELAAPWFETAEIIELHHDAKIDAPSGTAVTTAQKMAAASSTWAADPTRHETIPGARGSVGPAGIHLHSVRMRGMVAHQEVILGSTGQTLIIRQDSYDRSSYLPGVLLGCRRIAELPGLTLGLDSLLGV